MKHPSKTNYFLLPLGATLTTLMFLSGCGGGGGGGNSPEPTPLPSPLNATYRATFTPTGTIPSDGKAPTGTSVVAGNRVTFQTTYYLQPSVVTAVQAAIDKGLRDNNVGSAIGDNQVPANISFAGSGQLDSNGKVVFTSKKSVDICGTATLTISPTFTIDGTTPSGQGTYEVTFPNQLTVRVSGRDYHPEPTTGGVVFTCNNLPLRSGTVTFKPQ